MFPKVKKHLSKNRDKSTKSSSWGNASAAIPKRDAVRRRKAESHRGRNWTYSANLPPSKRKRSLATMSSSTMKFAQSCANERKASLRCIEDNYGETHEKSDACKKFFDEYKECTARERLERMRKNNPNYKG